MGKDLFNLSCLSVHCNMVGYNEQATHNFKWDGDMCIKSMCVMGWHFSPDTMTPGTLALMQSAWLNAFSSSVRHPSVHMRAKFSWHRSVWCACFIFSGAYHPSVLTPEAVFLGQKGSHKDLYVKLGLRCWFHSGSLSPEGRGVFALETRLCW